VKRFRYGLESVMRLSQARLDEQTAKMEQIAARLAATARMRQTLHEEGERVSRDLTKRTSVEGWQLAAVCEFRLSAAAEDRRLAGALAGLAAELEAQRVRVVEAHKKVRILEVLKEKRLSSWREEVDREQERAVSDLVVGQWEARRRQD
jgi:hypothetical protein